MKSSISKFVTALLVVFHIFNVVGQSNKEIWNLIEAKKRPEAQKALEQKIKSKNYSIDDLVTLHCLLEFDGKGLNTKNLLESLSKEGNPYPYLYALWFSEDFGGTKSYKSSDKLSLLNDLISEKCKNGTMTASAHATLAEHHVASKQWGRVAKEYAQIGAINEWQFVGPFSNESGSGFNKNYGPILEPSNEVEFTSKSNAPIKWFSPGIPAKVGWVELNHYISGTGDRIVYAQTFVNSATELDAYLSVGFSGNIKVWLNDQLLITEAQERSTDLDAYTADINC